MQPAIVDGDAVVFENLDELLSHELPSNITLYSQTTKSTNSFYNIKNELEGRGYQVNANDTICRQVSNRDKDLRRFAAFRGQALDEDAVRDFCKGQIAHYKVPRHVRVVDAFPLTATGKAQKFEMRKAMMAALGLHAERTA